MYKVIYSITINENYNQSPYTTNVYEKENAIAVANFIARDSKTHNIYVKDSDDNIIYKAKE